MTMDRNIEAEIDALLAGDASDSIIDTLLAIPRGPAANDTDETWEKVLHARLQERLARKMREVLKSGEDRKGSRSAA